MDTIRSLVQIFCPAFTAPTFENAVYLLLSWIKTSGRAQISELLRVRRYMPGLVPRGSDGEWKHFSVFYRFFSRACWSLDEMGKCLVEALAFALPEDKQVYVFIDDTVQKRGGPRILGAGMHRDGSESSRGSPQFHFGLNFVVLAVWIPIEYVGSGGLAIPIMFRLYRPRSTCSEGQYRKRTELAVELLEMSVRWLEHTQITVGVDNEYSCKTVLQAQPDGVDVAGPLQGRNVVYDPDFEPSRRGPTQKWGPRLGSLDELAEDERYPWEELEVELYGQQVDLKVKRIQAQWKSAPAETVLTLLITRDPTGRYDDAYFFRTREDASVEQVLRPIALRWGIEVTFRNCKQLMRISSVQNGFAQGKEPIDETVPGPQPPDKETAPTASERTVPFGMLASGFVMLWYLKHGNPQADVRRARWYAPWYTDKTTVSFRDMLAAFRRRMEQEGLWQTPSEPGFGTKTDGPSSDRKPTAA